jgi:regulator of sigma E protease
MEFLATVYMSLSWVLPVLVVLTILVFFHELGHYFIARKNGVRVEVFSIGFGPELFGWTDGHKTRWKISLVPLGGYVKMFGDADVSSAADHEKLRSLSPEEKQFTLEGKKVSQRMAVVAAGPIANILVTILCFWAVYFFTGEPVQEAVMGDVAIEGAAWAGGIRSGDRITSFNGKEITSFSELKTAIVKSPSARIPVTYERAGQSITTLLDTAEKDGHGIIGITPQRISCNFFTAGIAAVSGTLHLSWQMLKTFKDFFTGAQDSKQIGGLPSIAKMSKEAWSAGIFSLIGFMGVLSLNLGIINLFPVPVLDGGHLLFYTIEALRRKPVSEKVQEVAYKIGFWLLISLMVYSHWNDFVRFNFFGGISSFFSKLF